jgi:glutathione S-transferase
VQFIESELAQRPWFAGEQFTAADIQMSYPLEAVEKRVGLDGLPRIADVLRRMRERPAYQRAQQKGGEFGVPGFEES